MNLNVSDTENRRSMIGTSHGWNYLRSSVSATPKETSLNKHWPETPFPPSDRRWCLKHSVIVHRLLSQQVIFLMETELKKVSPKMPVMTEKTKDKGAENTRWQRSGMYSVLSPGAGPKTGATLSHLHSGICEKPSTCKSGVILEMLWFSCIFFLWIWLIPAHFLDASQF